MGQPPGFDFLGFTVRQFPAGKTHSGKWSTTGALLGFKTITAPSKVAISRYAEALTVAIHKCRAVSQEVLIHHLNPIIRGWAAYYSTGVAKAAFGRMDFHTYLKLQSWAKRRHPHTSGWWISAKYWRIDQGTWTFGTKAGDWLRRHDQTPIRRHVKVRGEKSPYDGDWSYWATRLGRHPSSSGATLCSSTGNAVDVPGAACTSATKGTGRSITSFRSPRGSAKPWRTSNSSTRGATTRKRPRIAPRPRVRVTSAESVRSRMRGNSHVRFCSRAGRATGRLSLTTSRARTTAPENTQESLEPCAV